MNTIGKIGIVVGLAGAVVAVIVMKTGGPALSTQPASQPAAGLPRLVDLGSTTCKPCKMMMPILEELRAEYAGRLQVEFIDVKENPAAAKPSNIQLIPTQIFFDASGRERWRHQGFIAKDAMLAQWKELGVNLEGTGTD